MHSNVKKRAAKVLIMVLVVVSGVIVILRAMSDNISFFVTPSQIETIDTKKDFRLGGFVVPGSIKNIDHDTIEFTVKDEKTSMIVQHHGYVPAIFRDGQGVVATGNIQNNIFISRELLTKHDENYMPKSLNADQ